MSRAASIRFPVDPRMVSKEKVARRLGVTVACFEEKRAQLEQIGFPRPDNILGTYTLEAVDRWIDQRAGLARDDDPTSAQASMLRSVRERAWAR